MEPVGRPCQNSIAAGDDAVAAPERRQWQLVLAVEALLGLGDEPLELLSCLRRAVTAVRPTRSSRLLARPRVEVGERLSSPTRSTAPSTRTWRLGSSQWSAAAARGFASSSAALRLSRFV